MSYTLRDGSQVEDSRLGRIKEFDARSLEHPVLRTLTSSQVNLQAV